MVTVLTGCCMKYSAVTFYNFYARDQFLNTSHIKDKFLHMSKYPDEFLGLALISNSAHKVIPVWRRVRIPPP
jgi:hypothetical protein